MSATVMESGTVTERADLARPSFAATMRAEWIKLRTVRSTWWTLAATVLLGGRGLEVSRHDDELRVIGLDAPAVGDLLFKHGLALHELTLVRSSLEDAFMTLTADSVEYHAASEGATR